MDLPRRHEGTKKRLNKIIVRRVEKIKSRSGEKGKTEGEGLFWEPQNIEQGISNVEVVEEGKRQRSEIRDQNLRATVKTRATEPRSHEE